MHSNVTFVVISKTNDCDIYVESTIKFKKKGVVNA